MATYTFNTSDVEEAALTWAVQQYNASPDTADVTNAQYARFFVNRWLDELIQQRRTARRATLESAYINATPTVQAQVNTLLGVTP